MQSLRKPISRKTIIIWSLIILGVIGIGMRDHLSNPKEPSYQGRSLSEWLNESDELKAREAVAQIGTNAIPFLLKSVASEDSSLKKKLLKLVLLCYFAIAPNQRFPSENRVRQRRMPA